MHVDDTVQDAAHNAHLESDLDEPQNAFKQKEMELNRTVDLAILKNIDKMPVAIYYILPNECAERFCYYGISPILNGFFRDYLGRGKDDAYIFVHLFKFMAYFTPLLGAALSDSFFGKYETIVGLSFVYVIGTALLSIFSTPSTLSFGGAVVGLVFVAIGTGGIKPCVSSHGGDQFLDIQKKQLNDFYNYFYLSINLGAIISNFAAPAVKKIDCFGMGEDTCYTWAFGMCAFAMFFAWVVFIIGKRTYRIVPPAGIFLPWVVIKILFASTFRWLSDGRKKGIIEYAADHYPADIVEEVRDVSIMFLVLIPAPIFWMGFDQNGSTWQNQYLQMRQIGDVIDADTSSVLNPILIVLIVPIFSRFIYPWIEKRYGRFRLIDRMLVGMGFAAASFIITAVIQWRIDSDDATHKTQILNKSNTLICNPEAVEKCINGGWQIIPYFVITVGEILFSISGLNFTYEEVGKRMKASSASLWLLTVAFGNLLDIAIAPLYESLGTITFFCVCVGFIVAAMLSYFGIRRVYVYKEDRSRIGDAADHDTVIPTESEMKKNKH